MTESIGILVCVLVIIGILIWRIILLERGIAQLNDRVKELEGTD
jgi:hypothetical protein